MKQHRFVAELLGQLVFVFRDVDKPQCVVTNSKPLLCSKGGVVAGVSQDCLPLLRSPVDVCPSRQVILCVLLLNTCYLCPRVEVLTL